MTDTSSLFTSLDEQLARVREANEKRGWGFTEDDFAKLGMAPDIPTGKEYRLVAVVLEVILPWKDGNADLSGTVNELWKLAAAQQEKSSHYGKVTADPKRLRLLAGIKVAPGLRWRVIDLAANWDGVKGTAPETVRNPSSPHVAVLAAAWLHPAWVRSMDGDNVPFVWLPGLQQATIPGLDDWSYVPCLHFVRIDSEVGFDAYWSSFRYSSCAVPVFRE